MGKNAEAPAADLEWLWLIRFKAHVVVVVVGRREEISGLETR